MRTLAALLLLAFAAVVPAASPALAQGFTSNATVLDMDEAFAFEVAERDGETVVLRFDIEPGYYLYREHLTARDEAGAALAVEAPAGVVENDLTFGRTEVYYEDVEIAIAHGGARSILLTYQGCQEGGICYPPTTRAIEVATLTASEDLGPGGFRTDDLGDSASVSSTTSGQAASSTFQISEPSGGMISSILERGGVALVLASFLGFGLLLAFTPCVFPMYPILAGTLARQGERLSTGRGFLLSLAYVLAMASAFGLLGLAAAWSGQNLQIVLQSPWSIAAVSVLFVALAASMFGFYELRVPTAVTNRFATLNFGRRGSLAQAAALGFTSALIVGPCVTAPLAGALLYIAQTADITLGAGALFALGLGKGIPLIAMGIFGASVLPRAGAWMERSKQVFGFLFLATAAYLVSRILPDSLGLALWALLLIAASVFLGAFDSLTRESGNLARAGKSLGLALALYGIALGVGATAGSKDPLRPLEGLTARGGEAGGGSEAAALVFSEVSSLPQVETALVEAAAAEAGGQRPSLVYFTADWCVTCKTIERRVLPEAQSRLALADVSLIKADVTRLSQEERDLMDAMGVVGPPTMIFFDHEAREVEDSRLIGEISVETLTRSAEAAKSALREGVL